MSRWFILCVILITSVLFVGSVFAQNVTIVSQNPGCGSLTTIEPGESVDIFLEVYMEGVTDDEGQGEGIVSQLWWDDGNGWGESEMSYSHDNGNNDVYMVTVGPFDQVGSSYPFVARATYTGEWVWACSFNDGIILVMAEGGQGCQEPPIDDNIHWNELYHNTFDPMYRSPFGAVKTNQGGVTIRFRTLANDAACVQMRVWNDRTDTETWYDLQSSYLYEDPTWGLTEVWETTIPVPTEPTILYYGFQITDGSAIVYYVEDDTKFDSGGHGLATSDMSTFLFNSFQLTVYDESYSLPDWAKGAVFYQIFPDRFRNGNADNDPIQDTDFIEGGLTVYKLDWNQPLEDPRDDGSDCPGCYGNQFYGGDLDGVIEKLDYLADLGVTAIYFNPIFMAPSNHLYDTQDYFNIDPYFGNRETFDTLISEAEARGINVVLDGVYNHVSYDSRYFDHFSRWDWNGNLVSPDGPGENDGSGACESPASPYRDWFYFGDREEVPSPGLDADGNCVPCEGELPEEPVCYGSWWGYASIPKLNAEHQDVRDLFFSGADSAVSTFWAERGASGWRFDVGGDIDPGLTREPDNDFWEEVRNAVRAVNPDAIFIGEEWGEGTPWMLGHEWDMVMNYRFRGAVLDWLFDGCDGLGCEQGGTVFIDNDSNYGSSSGEVNPITETEFVQRLRAIQEDYPHDSWMGIMNLMGSHDTNRVRFFLKKISNDDDELGRQKLMFLTLFQFTYPGSPTVYYGDEAGVSPDGAWWNGKWEDDPYNRVVYPWQDEGLEPDQELIDHYSALGQIRQDYLVFKTGEYEEVMADDDNRIFAFRRYDDMGNHGLVVLNRDDVVHEINVPVGRFLANGTVLEDVLNGGSYTVANGIVTIVLEPLWGAVLAGTGDSGENWWVGNMVPLSGETTTVQERTPLDFSIEVYRSNVTEPAGQGFGIITQLYGSRVDQFGGSWDDMMLIPLEYTGDAGNNDVYGISMALEPGFYEFTARSSDDGGQTWAWASLPNGNVLIEVTELPPLFIMDMIPEGGSTVTLQAGESIDITIEVYQETITDQEGQGNYTTAQLYWSPVGNDGSWYAIQNTNMTYIDDSDDGQNDIYQATIGPLGIGQYGLTARASDDDGETWSWAGANGIGNLNIQVVGNADFDYPFVSYDDFIETVHSLTSIADPALRQTQLDNLWQTLTDDHQVPFKMDDRVAFLYRGEVTESVLWNGDFNQWGGYGDFENAGVRQGWSDWWMLEQTFPSDARLDYKVVVDGNWMLDPANPYQQWGGYGPNSELRMSDYVYPQETIYRDDIAHGMFSDDIMIHSSILGYDVNYRVYTPAGYDDLSNLPVVYVTDGHEYADPNLGSMINVLDNMIADGWISPVIAVFIDPREPGNLGNNRRWDEYLLDYETYAEFVTQELVPVIDTNYNTNPIADARAILGTSLGGVFSAYMGVAHSDMFHFIAMNSPAFGRDIEQNEGQVFQMYQDVDLLPLEMFMTAGTIFDTEAEDDQFEDILIDKGYPYQYIKVNESHSWGHWRALIDEMLFDYMTFMNLTYDLSGTVMYRDGEMAVAGVMLQSGGHHAVSDEMGMFMVEDVVTGLQTLIPCKEGDVNGIEAYDAARIAQYEVGLWELDDLQVIAGDVTGNGRVGAYDAASIVRYVVGLDQTWLTGQWTFVPEMYTYNPLESDLTEQDFSAILYGEVTNNWEMPSSLALDKGEMAQSAIAATVSVEQGKLMGDLITVPVTTSDLSGLSVIAFQTALEYDPTILEFVEVIPGNITTDWSYATGNQDGSLNLAAYHVQPLSDEGTLFSITFRVVGELDAESRLKLTDFIYNDGSIGVELVDGKLAGESVAAPSNLALYANYPNPFNPITNIRYDVPEQMNVKLSVYDIRGQLVKTLVDDSQAAGAYTVQWNGTNAAGKSVASGVYIYRLETADQDIVKRMTLLK